MKSYLFCILVAIASADHALADSFGTGGNTFNIDFVTIGNPGNAADTTGSPKPAGSVAQVFRIGEFEISEQMVNKANALGGLGMTTSTDGADKPATLMTWNKAARFVNWLNTSTGNPPAYKFAAQPGQVGYFVNDDIQLWTSSDAGYNPNNLYRNSLARYFLPSVDEWYKAAYYDPATSIYYDYPTGSDAAPTPVASGTLAGTAVYGGQSVNADITLAGGLSPYGTMGQGGNVDEWQETAVGLINNSPTSNRIIRGGRRGASSNLLSSSSWVSNFPASGNNALGFRIASVATPEPATIALTVLALAALSTRRRKSVPHNRV